MKNLRKVLSLLSATLCATTFLVSPSCGQKENTPTLPYFDKKSFSMSGFWAPYEINEESLQLYKDSGMTTLAFNNHSLSMSSENQFYLGSKRTETALALCKQVGLKAQLQYREWIASQCGAPHSDAPFSDYPYAEYKDIITGVSIIDEPSTQAIYEWTADWLVEDFKKNYDVPYMINLDNNLDGIPSRVELFEQKMAVYESEVLQKFPENPYISMDFYPFRADGFANQWLANYERVGKLIAKYDATGHFYIQSATGNEFGATLTEDDIRLQLYVGLAFGAKEFGYYCYAMPRINKGDGSYEPMYTACMLDAEDKPTYIYDYVKKVNAEMQAFASAYLDYKFVSTMGITYYNEADNSFDASIAYMKNKSTSKRTEFVDRKYLAAIETTDDILVGSFEKESGEGYMIVNFGNPEAESAKDIEVTIELKGGASYLAVYGGKSGVPTIIKADDGKVKLPLTIAEGKFVIPLQ